MEDKINQTKEEREKMRNMRDEFDDNLSDKEFDSENSDKDCDN